MKEKEIIAKWEAVPVHNCRGIAFVRNVELTWKLRKNGKVKTEVIFLLLGKFTIETLSTKNGKKKAIEISIPDWEGSPNIAHLTISRIRDIYFPNARELREIFGDKIKTIPRRYKPFYFSESGPQIDFREYLEKNPQVIQEIERRFFKN